MLFFKNPTKNDNLDKKFALQINFSLEVGLLSIFKQLKIRFNKDVLIFKIYFKAFMMEIKKEEILYIF